MLNDLIQEYEKVTTMVEGLLKRHPELADEIDAAHCGLLSARHLLQVRPVDPRYQEGQIVRVRTVRAITFQGPSAWVLNCLANRVTGAVQVGKQQFIIGEDVEQVDEAVDPNLRGA